MNPYSDAHHILCGFSNSVARFPDSPALKVGSHLYSYSDLDRLATNIATAVQTFDPPECGLAGFLAHRSLTAYTSVLGILRSGKGYVPLNPKFPTGRLASMVKAAGLRSIVVGKEALPILNELLDGIDGNMTVVSDDAQVISLVTNRESRFRAARLDSQSEQSLPGVPQNVDADDYAYVLFTSGSTGVPKGVPVSHKNVVSYLNYVTDRYKVSSQDRFSQTFDLTFDLSVHDMFLCWGSGACLCCVPERSTMAPAHFIKENQISMWFSVPSVITFMQRMRLLKKDCFPSIRYSLFCGEPLLQSSAAAWQSSASSSVLENLYGPTEATIAITQYRWTASDEDKEFPNGIVPIGTPFTTQDCCVVDASYKPLNRGEVGELCLSGSQVTSGYLNDREKTREQFVKLSSDDALAWYRTGDLAVQNESGCFFYRGRVDNQLQVRGHRVELQEVENALRIGGNDSAIALGWPPKSDNVEAIYGVFCSSEELDTEQIMSHCRKQLPEYMIPQRIFFVPSIPLNANGKVDRRAVSEQIQELINEHAK